MALVVHDIGSVHPVVVVGLPVGYRGLGRTPVEVDVPAVMVEAFEEASDVLLDARYELPRSAGLALLHRVLVLLGNKRRLVRLGRGRPFAFPRRRRGGRLGRLE